MANTSRDDYQAHVLAGEPIGYWPLREDSDDRSGFAHHGHNHGSPEFISDATGGWVRLDGSSYIQIASDATFSLPLSDDGLTIEMWMRPQILNFSGDYIHWLGKGGAGKYEWGLRFYPLGSERPNRLSAYVWNKEGGCGAGAYFQDPIKENEWLHIVACFQPGDAATKPAAGVSIYKNGHFRKGPPECPTLYENSPDWSIYPSAGDAPLRFGTRSDPSNCLVGGLAEIAIYQRVLGKSEIDDHYQAGSSCFLQDSQ